MRSCPYVPPPAERPLFSAGDVDVTIVLPAYNEAENVEAMCEQVTALFADTDHTYEILFVDDGSTDGTWQKIERMCATDPRVRALRHRRNFGKASALANGFAHARGSAIITTDADLQYDPKDIMRLLGKLDEGWDVVSAYKVVRRDPLSKRIPSRVFNFVVRNTTCVPLHDINAGLKAFRPAAARSLIRFGHGELHRFFIVFAARAGYSVAEVPVESLYRTSGASKYGPERYMRGALDFLTVLFLSGYGERPLHALGYLGVMLSGIGTLLFGGLLAFSLGTGAAMIMSPLFGVSGLLVITGVQMVVSGLLAELLSLDRYDAVGSKVAQIAGVADGVSEPSEATHAPASGVRERG